MGVRANNMLQVMELTMGRMARVRVDVNREELEDYMGEGRILEAVDEALNFPVDTPESNLVQALAENVVRALLLDLADDENGPTVVFQDQEGSTR